MRAGWLLCLNSVMDVIEHFSRLFAYDAWANQEVLTCLRAARAPLPQALKWMSHIFAAERLWMERLEQKPQTLPVWAEANGKLPSYPHSGKTTWPPAAKPTWPRPSPIRTARVKPGAAARTIS
jgi:hypothetical protein